jgi:L-ascorbate metabolism protein UlaG (beta-lactamase superfamily)
VRPLQWPTVARRQIGAAAARLPFGRWMCSLVAGRIRTMIEGTSDLASRLRALAVPPGSLSCTWLEQSHVVLKTPAGLLVHVDPFLSRVVKPENHVRPRPFLEPGDADADIVFLTHDHRDHTDPLTLAPMARRSPRCRFVGPRESCERVRSLGVAASRIEEVAEGDAVRFDGGTATAVYAENTSEHDRTTHLGFVFDVGGIRLYHVGDTRRDPDGYLERLGRVRGSAPDVVVVPINEGYNNPGISGAVRLVEIVDPRFIVPCHWDCFVHNTADPAAFERALPPALRPRVRRLPHGEPWVVGPAGPDPI